MGNTPAGRHLQNICTFGRVGLHTSRRRAADAPAPLERAPSSERGVAGQLPRPARRSKKGPVRRGLRGASGQGRRPFATSRRSLQLYNTRFLSKRVSSRRGLQMEVTFH